MYHIIITALLTVINSYCSCQYRTHFLWTNGPYCSSQIFVYFDTWLCFI